MISKVVAKKQAGRGNASPHPPSETFSCPVYEPIKRVMHWPVAPGDTYPCDTTVWTGHVFTILHLATRSFLCLSGLPLSTFFAGCFWFIFFLSCNLSIHFEHCRAKPFERYCLLQFPALRLIINSTFHFLSHSTEGSKLESVHGLPFGTIKQVSCSNQTQQAPFINFPILFQTNKLSSNFLLVSLTCPNCTHVEVSKVHETP